MKDVVESLVGRAIRAGAPLAHYLRAVILRTPRVAAAVTATAATSSDEIGSTTFGREREANVGDGVGRSGDK